MFGIDDRIKQNPAYGNVLYDNREDFFAGNGAERITEEHVKIINDKRAKEKNKK